MRGTRWETRRRGTSKLVNFPRKPDPLQLEVLAEDKVSRFDRTVVSNMFSTYWRIVAIGGTIVGYSPYPDASLVLTVYSAGKVLTQIYRYVTEDKARLGPLPGSEMVPKNGIAMQDYWHLGSLDHCRALMWYALYSSHSAQPDLGVLASGWEWSVREFLEHVRVYDVSATNGTHEQLLLWPSLYWQHLRSRDVRLNRMNMSPRGITERLLSGESTAMAEFTDTWLRHTVRGTSEGDIGWVLGRRE